MLINAFSHAFGPGYWDVATRAGLAGITDQRDAEYSGPAIQALANLTADERATLQQQLAQIVGKSFSMLNGRNAKAACAEALVVISPVSS